MDRLKWLPVLFLLSSMSYAVDLMMTVDPVTERENGTAIDPATVYYEFYQDGERIGATQPGETTFNYSFTPQAGTYAFTVSSVDSDGLKSAPSPTVEYVAVPPKTTTITIEVIVSVNQ